MLLHHNLKDVMPLRKTLYKPHAEWLKAAEQREILLSKHNAKLTEQYNCHSHTLPQLKLGESIRIQNPLNRRWDTTGRVVETLPNRQYRIRVDGSGRITLRNRRFLRIIENKRMYGFPIPSADYPTPDPSFTPQLDVNTPGHKEADILQQTIPTPTANTDTPQPTAPTPINIS